MKAFVSRMEEVEAKTKTHTAERKLYSESCKALEIYT